MGITSRGNEHCIVGGRFTERCGVAGVNIDAFLDINQPRDEHGSVWG